MRGDDELSVLASGDGDRHGRREIRSGSTSIDDLSSGADVNDMALEHLADGFLELGGSGGVEELQEPGGRAADVVAAVGYDAQKRLAAANGTREAIESAVLAGAPLLIDKPLEVLGLLDLLAAIPAARVRGDDLDASRKSKP